MSRDDDSGTKNHEKHLGRKAQTVVSEIKIIEKLSITSTNINDLISISIFQILYATGLGNVLDFNANYSMQSLIDL